MYVSDRATTVKEGEAERESDRLRRGLDEMGEICRTVGPVTSPCKETVTTVGVRVSSCPFRRAFNRLESQQEQAATYRSTARFPSLALCLALSLVRRVALSLVSSLDRRDSPFPVSVVRQLDLIAAGSHALVAGASRRGDIRVGSPENVEG